MTGSEETEYACPDCGADVPSDAKSCPSCGVTFAWEGQEAAAEESPPATEEEPAPKEETKGEGFVHGGAEAPEAGQAAAEKEGRAPPPEPAPEQKGRLYGGHLSILGVAFVVLAVLAVIGTIVLMHWDVWISGASKETIGPRQDLLIDLGYLGILVSLAVVIYDVLRHR